LMYARAMLDGKVALATENATTTSRKPNKRIPFTIATDVSSSREAEPGEPRWDRRARRRTRLSPRAAKSADAGGTLCPSARRARFRKAGGVASRLAHRRLRQTPSTQSRASPQSACTRHSGVSSLFAKQRRMPLAPSTRQFGSIASSIWQEASSVQGVRQTPRRQMRPDLQSESREQKGTGAQLGWQN